MSANESEFQKIYDAFQPKILRYLTHLASESEAEDLTQETFVKIHQRLENFRGESQLSTWIYRIATNTALDRLRSPSFQRAAQISLSENLDETELADKVICPEDKKPLIEKQLIREEMNECIRGYIEKLPENYRTVLVLSEWVGLKNNEIAEILGVTLDAVKIRLHRAKTKLKEELETHCEFYWVEEMPCSVK
ncbi:MAG: sigma-70 family RNA polymerase sigma factor [Anaerolineales bacterium]|nr:sigma-70 family RNA polymerase sigma factor [Anaerolineales bacterium]